MTIIDKLKQSIETATGLTFYYHAVGTLNEEMDNASFPCVYAFPAESSAVEDKLGVFHERLNLAVFFCNVTDYDFNALENEEIIDGCKKSAFKWLTALRTDKNFTTFNVNNAERVYDQFDVIVTGYGVDITIEEADGIGACDL